MPALSSLADRLKRRVLRWEAARLGSIACVHHPRRAGFALTFDDGPAPLTPAILDYLKQAGVPAAFFFVGEHLRRHPGLARRALREGHTVGNHTQSHPVLPGLPRSVLRAQLGACSAALRAETGETPRYFRPCYGWHSHALSRAVHRAQLSSIAWSAYGEDWRPQPPAEIADRVLSGLRPGGIVLLHDGSDHPDDPALAAREATLAALPLLLAGAARLGLEPVPLPELLSLGRPHRVFWRPSPEAVGAPPKRHHLARV
jgi:peptidoglycan-N-acetylglucosamine deacetylase